MQTAELAHELRMRQECPFSVSCGRAGRKQVLAGTGPMTSHAFEVSDLAQGGLPMTIKSKVRKLVETLTNTHIFRVLPHGVDPSCDIKRLLPGYTVEVVFDVGANVGQSAKKFVSWFPESQIYCFEPVTSTFAELQRSFGALNNVHCFQLAFGASKGRGKALLHGSSVSYSLLGNPDDACVSDDTRIEDVDIETVSEFCRSREIERISFLKIDTEGYDLAVLKGAGDMLDRKRIDLIEVEAGMNPRNQRHVSFEELKRYLEDRGYLLFGIYDQKHERRAAMPYMRRSDPVFVSERVTEVNR